MRSENDREILARQQLAHDLRSPIRAIAIYADMVAQALQSPSENKDNLEKYSTGITEAAEELSTRLDVFADEDLS